MIQIKSGKIAVVLILTLTFTFAGFAFADENQKRGENPTVVFSSNKDLDSKVSIEAIATSLLSLPNTVYGSILESAVLWPSSFQSRQEHQHKEHGEEEHHHDEVAEHKEDHDDHEGESNNPHIRFFGDMIYFNSNRDDSIYENGFDIRELEIGLSAEITHNIEADFMFAVHREHEAEHDDHAEGNIHEHGISLGHATHYALHLEEGFLVFKNLPLSTTIRLGKMRTAIGRANVKHRHNLGWFDYPAVLKTYFNTEGLMGVGGDISFNVIDKIVTFIFQIQRDESGAYFNTAEESEWYHNFKLKNRFHLGEHSSLEINAGYLFALSKIHHEENGGAEELEDITHSVLIADITFDAQEHDGGLLLTAEFFLFKPDHDEFESSKGGLIGIDYRLNEWFSGGFRFDYVEHPYEPEEQEKYFTLYATVNQTEMMQFRGGFTHIKGDNWDENRIFLQVNFGFGFHKPHDH